MFRFILQPNLNKQTELCSCRVFSMSHAQILFIQLEIRFVDANFKSLLNDSIFMLNGIHLSVLH